MLQKPLVSIIIPTFNRAKMITTAIESVLNQTYPNIEIIVIDDGSTDESKQILEGFKNRINCLNTQHKGIAHARNCGMKAAKGEYIAFLDSDDSYFPFKIALQMEFLETHSHLGMVFTELSGKYENGIFDTYHMRNYHRIWKRKGWNYEDVFELRGSAVFKSINRKINYYIGNLFDYVLVDTLIPMTTSIFPKNILNKIGLQNEIYKVGEDYEFSVRICKNYSVGFLNIPTYITSHHKEQTTYMDELQLKEKRKLLKEISEEKNPYLGALKQWAINDQEYYQKKKKFINTRLAEIHAATGRLWIDFKDKEMAKKEFRKSIQFCPENIYYRIMMLICFLPKIFDTQKKK